MLKTSASLSLHGGNFNLINLLDTKFLVASISPHGVSTGTLPSCESRAVKAIAYSTEENEE